MGLINRDKDLTEQREIFENETAVVGVSALIQFGSIPYPAVVERATVAAYGLSGSPILGLQIQRFVTGAGLTTIPLNGSSLLTVTAFSTSGVLTMALPAVSSTLVQLQTNDQLQVVTSGANTAATYNVTAVIRCLNDFKTHFGLGAGA